MTGRSANGGGNGKRQDYGDGDQRFFKVSPGCGEERRHTITEGRRSAATASGLSSVGTAFN